MFTKRLLLLYSKRGNNMDLNYTPVNLTQELDTCLKFRKSAWDVSFGSSDDFSEEDTINWFNKLAVKSPSGFFLVRYKEEIIGQVELKFSGGSPNEPNIGYVYLFYLIPEYRGSGVGQRIHDYTLDLLVKNGCQGAMLRYIPGNARAEKFYLRNGWFKSGDVDLKRGQLMHKKFSD